MPSFPVILNIVISSGAFIAAAWYFNRIMASKGIPGGLTRGFLVFIIASVAALSVGEAVDWFFPAPQVTITEMR